jgi:hypothetical protein
VVFRVGHYLLQQQSGARSWFIAIGNDPSRCEVRIGVLAAVRVTVLFIWIVTLCRLVGSIIVWEWRSVSLIQASASESTRRHNPEQRRRHLALRWHIFVLLKPCCVYQHCHFSRGEYLLLANTWNRFSRLATFCLQITFFYKTSLIFNWFHIVVIQAILQSSRLLRFSICVILKQITAVK